ncbi:UNVERIFIED_CONTAM: alpha/beta hydrolase family protein [Acetivibrio alkalicellulosi]
MNEACSRFVDNIAIEKIINEKLIRVSHSPKTSYFTGDEISLADIYKSKIDVSKIKYLKGVQDLNCIEIPSFYQCFYYEENNTIYLYNSSCNEPIGNILLIHGLFDESVMNYTFLIRLLNELKFNVFLMILPYHLRRKPLKSLFSGEYFLSADLYRSKIAFKQAILDIEASLQIIENNKPIMLVGFSMGGCVSLRYFTLAKKIKGIFLINPVMDLSNLIWDNPMLGSIRDDLDKCNCHKSFTDIIFEELDPCKNMPDNLDMKYVAVANSKYDLIIEGKKLKNLIDNKGFKNIYNYHAGHLNILRVPKLSKDIFDHFCKIN